VSTAFVDTNIILRYLIGDDPEKMRACTVPLREIAR
jgi:hypothetical protein